MISDAAFSLATNPNDSLSTGDRFACPPSKEFISQEKTRELNHVVQRSSLQARKQANRPDG